MEHAGTLIEDRDSSRIRLAAAGDHALPRCIDFAGESEPFPR